MAKDEFIANFDAYIKNHCVKYDVQPIDPILYRYILSSLDIAWQHGDMEGFERCASVHRSKLETSE